MPHSLFRELYAEELARRDALRGSVALPLGLLSVIGGALGALIADHPFRGNLIDGAFWTAAMVSIYLLVRGAYYLMKAYHGDRYRLLASPDKLLEHHDNLRSWHQQHGDVEKQLPREFDDYVFRQAAAVTAFNRQVNNNRSEYLFRANTEVVFCALFALTAYAAHIAYRREDKPQAIQSVQIAEPIHVSIKRPNDSAPAASSATTTAPRAPAKTRRP